MVLTIDFFALRARCNQWLVDFFNTANPTRNLDQLPNMAYSVALATFHLHLEAAAGQEKEDLLARSDSLLQGALLSFPSVLLSLLDKCSIEPDPSVIACSYFLVSTAKTRRLLKKIYSTFEIIWEELWFDRNSKLSVVMGNRILR